jgi:hypothetical protein
MLKPIRHQPWAHWWSSFILDISEVAESVKILLKIEKVLSIDELERR